MSETEWEKPVICEDCERSIFESEAQVCLYLAPKGARRICKDCYALRMFAEAEATGQNTWMSTLDQEDS